MPAAFPVCGMIIAGLAAPPVPEHRAEKQEKDPGVRTGEASCLASHCLQIVKESGPQVSSKTNVSDILPGTRT